MDQRRVRLLPLAMVIGSLATSAALVTRGVRQLAREPREHLAIDDATRDRVERPVPARAHASPSQTVALLATNMFEAEPEPPQPAASPPIAAQTGALEPEPATSVPRCAPEVRLLGSVVNTTYPEHSLAVVRKDGGTRLLRVGARLGELELIALRSARAYFRRPQGSVCRVPVFLPHDERPRRELARTPDARSVKAKKRAPLFSPAELNAGVRQVGGNHYAVTRELVMRAIGNPAALARWARFRMSVRNGQVEGLELTRINANSPLKQLGLRRGDVLRHLNGHRLTDASEALKAMRLLSTDAVFSLAILRDGAPDSLHYDIE